MKKIFVMLFISLLVSCKTKNDSVPALTDGYMKAVIEGYSVEGFRVLNRSYQSSTQMVINGLISDEMGFSSTSKEILIYVNTPSIAIGKYKIGGVNYQALGTCAYYQLDKGIITCSPGYNSKLDSGYVYVTAKNENSISGVFEFSCLNSANKKYLNITKGEFKVPLY